MNIVFWLGVVVVAFLLWYYLSKHFFRIGGDFKEMINNLKEKFNEQENNSNES